MAARDGRRAAMKDPLVGNQAAVPTAVPVVRAQVVSQQPAPELQSFWHFGGGLFDCMDNGEICCLGCWCPCWIFGKLLQQARLSAQPLFGCCMFALPVLALLIVVGGINQLRLLGEVAESCPQDTMPACDPDPCEADPAGAACEACQRCEEAIERYQRQAALANSVLSVITMVYLGLLLGYHRVKLQKQMAAPEVEPLPLSILLHCVPCTSPCALCQEARAAAAYELVPIQPPFLMSRTPLRLVA